MRINFWDKYIQKIALIISSIVAIWIVGYTLINNYYWDGRKLLMILLSIGGVVILGIIYNRLKKIESQLELWYWPILVIFLLIFFIIEIILGLKLEFTPTFDLEAIYGGAKEWYETGKFVDHEWYFYLNGNNRGGLFSLYAANIILGRFTTNYYLIAVLYNTAGIVVTGFYIIILRSYGKKKVKSNKRAQ